jgi:uncharacterized protein YdhG (YjbR/CyaY superfamily)
MKMVAAVSVEAYLAAVPEPARGTLTKVRATIRAEVPKDAVEKISYGMPIFYGVGAQKGMLIGYAAFKEHCSLFPGALVAEFAEELKGYKTSKGTIQFAVDKAPPVTLIKKLVRAAVARNERAVLAKKTR